MCQIDATDVLSAMGAIPSGFRPSTLNKLLVEEGQYKHTHTFMTVSLTRRCSILKIFVSCLRSDVQRKSPCPAFSQPITALLQRPLPGRRDRQGKRVCLSNGKH